MTEKLFIDTNIFIYAFQEGKDKKKQRAIGLIKSEKPSIVTSIQVLNEFIFATIKKGLLSRNKAIETAMQIEKDFEIIPLDRAVFFKGIEIFNELDIQLSLWDSLIIAAAVIGGCDILYSEDMKHNFVVEGVKIFNPFLDT